MKTNKEHEKKREAFDDICETCFVNGNRIVDGQIMKDISNQNIIDALKAASAEKDRLIEHLMDEIDDLEASSNKKDELIEHLRNSMYGLEGDLASAMQWGGECHG